MLVTFKTDVGNISMFGSDALQMIKMMGHSEAVPGAILADDVPQALSRLKAALKKKEAAPPSNENDDEDEPVISTAHRGLPLVNLLTDAAAAGCDVMWE
ncbi:protein of unknown function [Nitrosomonas sp. Nm51]|uniref:DUF1840 domain-containing protein n=1 Tax=Nitrosomonas sp. Nm51 TaxID=133720 RepID=UPI0008D3E243|nr:DUF1840 domain-containing protein [Nitrosomonas sp. Nm51]SER47862.1 protein of unknown function [Nitrosomonas sp. Nm51]